MVDRYIRRIYHLALAGRELRSSLVGKAGGYSWIKIEFKGKDGLWRWVTTIKSVFEEEAKVLDKALWHE